MDGPELSRREQRILAEIEETLRADGRLDRALRTMRRGPRWVLGGVLRGAVRVPSAVLALLVALSTGLLLVSADVHSPGALAAFGVVWALTSMLAGLRLLGRRRGLRR
ncbi:hypothetical protein ACGF07_07245 [Kitasatospora sp. NPDC048194]|uniref:hypothetical protein n=1 Tax=Kitasatospora sp. NPDC048194 TaxID=3364045 RepID=UPI00371D1DAE